MAEAVSMNELLPRQQKVCSGSHSVIVAVPPAEYLEDTQNFSSTIQPDAASSTIYPDAVSRSRRLRALTARRFSPSTRAEKAIAKYR